MASPSQKKLLTEMLNLESVRVTRYQNISGIGLIIRLEALIKEARVRASQSLLTKGL
ncbi:MAG: hypothetical protein WBM44_22015 [Waterburya sp.]